MFVRLAAKLLEPGDRPKSVALRARSGASQSARLPVAVVVLVTLIAQLGMAGSEQSAALPVNPRAVDFEVPETGIEIRGYRVELFHSRSDTRTAQAVSSLDVTTAAASRQQDRVLIEMRNLFVNVPDGEYIVTLQSLGPDGISDRSEPAGPFRVSGQFKSDADGRSAIEPKSSTPRSDEPTADRERGERFWTIIGAAMGIAAFLVPFIIK